jgi:thiol-disulfide isomerase/thioredoxin
MKLSSIVIILFFLVLSVVIVAYLFPSLRQGYEIDQLASSYISKQAPEFTGVQSWLNSEPLTMEELQGKVVLVDFWTYSCINCIRTLPYLTAWYDKYHELGLEIVGVHTPEFAFEKVPKNVSSALKKHKIKYPIALDNEYKTWQAYDNHYWPAKYLVDQQGKIVYTHFGEGKYRETEEKIRQLLNIDGRAKTEDPKAFKFGPQTPEIYLGITRNRNITNSQKVSPNTTVYQLPDELALHSYGLKGEWQHDEESVELESDLGEILLHFVGSEVNFVAEADSTAELEIYLDNELIKTFNVQGSTLYNLYSGEHVDGELRIKVKGNGLKAYAFTFG